MKRPIKKVGDYFKYTSGKTQPLYYKILSYPYAERYQIKSSCEDLRFIGMNALQQGCWIDIHSKKVSKLEGLIQVGE